MPMPPKFYEFMGRMLTINQISSVTGLSRRAIRNKIKNGRLDRAGKIHPVYQEIMHNGKVYPSVAKACRDLGISNQKLYRRVHDARKSGKPVTEFTIDGVTPRLLPRRPKLQ